MFNVRLKYARKIAGLSMHDLGRCIGVSRAVIKKYETGSAMPSSDILLKLSRVLKVRVEYFFRPDTVILEDIEFCKCDLH